MMKLWHTLPMAGGRHPLGGRSAKTVKRLYEKLAGIEVSEFCTDEWLAFQKVLPAEEHKVGKAY